MDGDGNCLFRAVAHQVWADPERHDVVREQCMQWIANNRDHFQQFIHVDFDSYVAHKRQLKVYGDHAEIQAMAEIYGRPIEVYSYGTEPLNIFLTRDPDCQLPPLCLSYHGNAHYNSVIDPEAPAFGIGLGLPGLKPAPSPDAQITAEVANQSEHEATEAAMYDALSVQQAMAESAVDGTDEAMLQQVLAASEQARARAVQDELEAALEASRTEGGFYLDPADEEAAMEAALRASRSAAGWQEGGDALTEEELVAEVMRQSAMEQYEQLYRR
eukprot:c32640_g1_i1.p2 GENE.c32640_g1_i1~~c32640_g1_i1.p2  ORF type:complete len:308 (+),score=65.31 c32640_g1_i1:111-926(+)